MALAPVAAAWRVGMGVSWLQSRPPRAIVGCLYVRCCEHYSDSHTLKRPGAGGGSDRKHPGHGAYARRAKETWGGYLGVAGTIVDPGMRELRLIILHSEGDKTLKQRTEGRFFYR